MVKNNMFFEEYENKKVSETINKKIYRLSSLHENQS